MPDVEIQRPGNYGSGGEPGLNAVRAKYGDEMVAEMRAWPKITETYTRAILGDRFGVIEPEREVEVLEAVDKAAHRLARAKRDRDYALDQAKATALVTVLPFPLGVVPTVNQWRLHLRIDCYDCRRYMVRCRACHAPCAGCCGCPPDAVPTPVHRSKAELAELAMRAAKPIPEVDDDEVNRRKAEIRAAKERLE